MKVISNTVPQGTIREFADRYGLQMRVNERRLPDQVRPRACCKRAAIRLEANTGGQRNGVTTARSIGNRPGRANATNQPVATVDVELPKQPDGDSVAFVC